MNFEEAGAGQILERNIVYSTDYFLVTRKARNLVRGILEEGGVISLSVLDVADLKEYEILTNVTEKRRDFIALIWDSNL
jgi:hypothetical protein